ncbi:hypothetical protein C2845_PM16G04100 [Panicum miliaceum]|uniref:Uncharacterized protein n=1 Tax=Panicum miliaceum TaxID=4540 RepID=A0A3L6PW75_PANMI|nr:hypothetical protein C2845_PM16G04100 [Panicum miliaceum]
MEGAAAVERCRIRVLPHSVRSSSCRRIRDGSEIARDTGRCRRARRNRIGVMHETRRNRIGEGRGRSREVPAAVLRPPDAECRCRGWQQGGFLAAGRQSASREAG